MADDLTDEQLRKELISLGEKSIGPITATTRSLYIKKLNHLRARRRSNAKATGRKQTSKKLLGFSSDESEDDTDRKSTFDRSRQGGTSSSSRSVGPERKRTPATRKTPRPSQTQVKSTPSLVRPSLRKSPRDRGQNATLEQDIDDDPSMVSATAQTSFVSENNTLDVEDVDFTDSGDDSFGLKLKSDMPGWNAGESSDSDLETMGSFTLNKSSTSSGPDDSHSPQHSPFSWNTSQTHHRASISPRNASRANRMTSHDYSLNKPTGNAKHRRSTSIKSPPEKLSKAHEFKTQEEPYASHHPYISMFLLVFVGLFFATLAFMYMNVTSEEAIGNLLDGKGFVSLIMKLVFKAIITCHCQFAVVVLQCGSNHLSSPVICLIVNTELKC